MSASSAGSSSAASSGLPYDSQEWERRVAEAKERRKKALEARGNQPGAKPRLVPRPVTPISPAEPGANGVHPIQARAPLPLETPPEPVAETPAPAAAPDAPKQRRPRPQKMLALSGLFLIGVLAGLAISLPRNNPPVQQPEQSAATAPAGPITANVTPATSLPPGPDVILTAPRPAPVPRAAPPVASPASVDAPPKLNAPETIRPPRRNQPPVEGLLTAQAPELLLLLRNFYPVQSGAAARVPPLLEPASVPVLPPLEIPALDQLFEPESGISVSPAQLVSAAIEEAASSPAAPLPVSELRIIAHLPSGTPDSTFERMNNALAPVGYTPVSTVNVAIAIDGSHIRYFHKADEAHAAEIAAALVRFLQEPVTIRDFTHFQPQPLPGSIEIWLAGAPR